MDFMCDRYQWGFFKELLFSTKLTTSNCTTSDAGPG